MTEVEKVETQKVVSEISTSGAYVLGEWVRRFEASFAEYLGVRNVVSCANGTDALELALRAVGVRTGDRVATVSNAGGYSTTAIFQIGATPVFLDCDDQGRLSLHSLERVLQSDAVISAVVITHLYGLNSRIEEVVELCERFTVPLVEDCAQSTGARVQGKALGSFGKVSTFSFYPTKNLGALGDGGAVATSNDELAQTVQSLRQYGWTSKYFSAVPNGKNSRLDEIQAAVLSLRLASLDANNVRRREIWKRYSESLTNKNYYMIGDSSDAFVAHLAVLVTPPGLREKTSKHLSDMGIENGVHYPFLDYQQPSWHQNPLPICPGAEALRDRIITIPLFPQMTAEEINVVSSALSGLDEFRP
jgi:dTDP-4-amino-4,6-dideoxygalactose transaminase